MKNLLLSDKVNFRIVRLADGDAKRSTDSLVDFKKLVLANETMYPGIGKWLKEKVLPGLKSSERTAFIGYVNDEPIVSAVVKRGPDSKFCHLRINDDFQDDHLGEVFFGLMALEVRRDAQEIHFTLPESLWSQKKEFFKSFGFAEINKAGTQYRLFDEELKCSASFTTVWQAFMEKLPKLMRYFSISGYSMFPALLMSVRPEYAHAVLNGKKMVEIRRRFNKKWVGYKVSLYASRPMKALVGEATIADIIFDHPSRIWEVYGSEIGCAKVEYDKYTSLADKIFAIFLKDIQPFNVNIPLTQISFLTKQDLVPPQSYYSLANNQPWADAVSIATLLQGCLNVANPVVL